MGCIEVATAILARGTSTTGPREGREGIGVDGVDRATRIGLTRKRSRSKRWATHCSATSCPPPT